MSLTLITGPANAAKAGEVLARYRAALSRSPVLVVPRGADVDHYQRELAGSGALVGGAVLPFGRLIEEIASSAGVAGRPIGPVARERVVAAAVRDVRLRELAASAQSPGFAAALGTLLGELGRAGVDPEAFRSALPRGERELGDLVSAYHARLHRLGRDDPERLAARAVAALVAAPDAWGGRPVFLYGFDDLTPLQLSAVRALAEASDVTLALSWEPRRAAFAARDRAVQALAPLASERVELPALAEHYARPARPALHHLERHLFDASVARAPSAEGVRLLEAGGERAEVELVAAEVLGALRDGVPAHEVAVVFRAPDRWGALVEQVFTAYGIPFAVQREVPFGHTVLGAALCGLARCALGGGAASDLLHWLRAPGILDRPELADALEAELLREDARDAVTARAHWEARRFRLDEIDRVAEAAAAGPRQLLERLDRTLGRLLAAPRKRRAAVLGGAEQVDARAVAAARRAFGELTELAGYEASAGAATAPAELVELLAELRVRIGDPPHPGAVEVADPLAIRARRYRVVVVAGLQEGEFPRAATPDPFLDDGLRTRLAGAGLPLEPRDALADERHLLYACASRPTDRLVLSYRTADEEGGLATPSFFLDDVRALFAEAPVTRRRPLSDVAWPLRDAPTEAERERSAAALSPPVPPPVLASLRGEAARAALVQQPAMSASGLEAYAGCPVRWLVEHHLRPKALEPTPEPLARGSLTHQVLATTMRRLRERHGSARLTPGSLPDALEALDDALAEHLPDAALHPDPAVRAALLRRTEAELRRVLEHEAACETSLEPERFELGFGRAEHDFPLVELAEGKVKLRGQVDRVDVDDARGEAVIRDYKASAQQSMASDRWDRDRRLQVALYMLAVQQLLGLRVVGGLFVPLSGDPRARGLVLDEAAARVGGFVRNDVKDQEEFDAVLAAAEAKAAELAERLASGELHACPATCKPRGGCSYPGICRAGQA